MNFAISISVGSILRFLLTIIGAYSAAAGSMGIAISCGVVFFLITYLEYFGVSSGGEE